MAEGVSAAPRKRRVLPTPPQGAHAQRKKGLSEGKPAQVCTSSQRDAAHRGLELLAKAQPAAALLWLQRAADTAAPACDQLCSSIHNGIAACHMQLGHLPAAREHLGQALISMIQVAGGEDTAATDVMALNLAGIDEALGNPVAQTKELAALFQRQQKRLGSGHVALAPTLRALMAAYSQLNDPVRAAHVGQRLVNITCCDDNPHVSADDVADLLHVAGLYRRMGALAEAAALYERGLLALAEFGATTTDQAQACSYLAACQRALGAHQGAISAYERGIALLESSAPSAALGALLHELARTLFLEGRLDAAVLNFNRARVVLESSLGALHHTVATCLVNLANTYLCLCSDSAKVPEKNRALATAALAQAFTIRQVLLGSEDPSTQDAADQLAQIETSERARSPTGDQNS